MLSRIKFSIEPLVDEILDQLPAEVWTNKTSTFLDPAIGGGQFVRAIEARLRAAGHSDENISGRVYGCESSILHINYAVNKYNLAGTYSVGDFLLQDYNGMKFDVVVGNPPYQGKAETHQKFFNKSVTITVDGGTVIFIQPATPYFNKKESIRSGAKEMLANVKKYQTSVKIVKGSVFENAGIFTSLAITTLKKEINDSGVLLEYQSESGSTYTNIDIESVNMLEMNPDIYKSLVTKVFSVIKQNNSLQSLVTTSTLDKKLYVQKVRGHINHIDFYTFLSKDKKYWKMDASSDYGIKVKNSDELKSLISYLTSYVARFCLAIYKFNGNNHMGEFKSVPLVTFNKTWDDQELCSYFGITQLEYQEITRCIPKYYDQ